MDQKIKKSPGQKKLMKSNISVSPKFFFDQIPFFCHFKNGKNSEKSFKLPKIQFHEKKKSDLFDFTNFFPGLF